MFLPYRGTINMLWFPKTASTAIAEGGVQVLTSGQLTPAAAASTSVAGVSAKDVTSTDSDYAATTQIPVWVPLDDTEFIADVTGGSATAAMVGAYRDLSSDGLTVNVGGTSHNNVLITQFLSAAKVVCKLNSAAQFKNAS